MTEWTDGIMNDLRSSDSEKQRQALIEVSTNPAPAFISPAGQLLSASEPRIRSLAVEALVACAKSLPDHLGAAVVPLLADSDELVRSNAVGAIADLGYCAAREQVEWLLLHDPSPIVRADAAETLGALKDPLSVPALFLAQKDRETSVRAYAAISIGLLGSTADLTTLEAHFGSEPDCAVRAEMHGACIRLGGLHHLDQLMDLIDTCSEDAAWNALNTVQDLVEREPVASLVGYDQRIGATLAGLARRIPLARGQIDAILVVMRGLRTTTPGARVQGVAEARSDHAPRSADGQSDPET